jgi:hypothetical protein
VKILKTQRALIFAATVVLALAACSGGTDDPPTPTPTPDANVVRLAPSQDATLYEHADGALANSAGQTSFVGMTNRRELRRTLIAFDLTSLPADREVVGVTLEMRMSKSASGAFDVAMYRVTTPWAEGIAAAGGMGGKGTDSTSGDPTWTHAASPGTPWDNPGGDYLPKASAVTSVDNFVRYSWSGAGLVDDVLAWASGAEPNYGWLLIGDEDFQKTAKRFDAREHEEVTRRPTLVVELAPAS